VKHTNTRRYAVKTSKESYANIVSSHCTLGEAYKALVKLHKEQHKHRKFIMAQNMIAIISSEESNEIIEADIHAWSTQDHGPPSRQRLPLPIVVHQWNPKFNIYLRFGAPRA
jgi:hypothetical protein